MINKLFGRDEIVATLKKRIDGFKKGYRQNIALIGSPLMGKTLVLRSIFSDLNNSIILAIYVDLNKRPIKQVIRGICSQLLLDFLKNHDIDTSGDFDYLMNKSQAFLPETIAKIKLINSNLDRKKEHQALIDTFNLTKVFSQECNRPCLLILDEFQNLEDFGNKDIFAELAKLILVQKTTMYLIASSSVIRAKEILSHRLSLLFGNFEVLEIKPYSISESSEFIAKNLNVKINNTHKKFLINFTYGHPFYLDKLCRELFLQAKRYNLDFVNESIFIEVFENLLFEEWGLFNQRFMNFLDKICDRYREDYIMILASIISGCSKVKEIAKHLNKKEKIIQQRMSRLYDAGVIVKNGDFLHPTDKVFSFWLNSVHNKRQEFDYADESVLRTNFRKDLFTIIDNFSFHLQKAVIERIVELFNLFKNECVQMERRKIILTDFNEIKLLQTESKNFDAIILAKSPDIFWVVAVKNGILSQEDITEFVLECRKYGYPRNQKRVIITLNELDTNAKLKALQDKILTWQVQDLNSLFELYNRPAIFL